MEFYSRRVADVRGYLEFIYHTDDDRPDSPTPRAVAYITDIYGSVRNPFYVGVYGIHEVKGRTVAAVKEQLFSLIESGQ